MFSRTNKCRTLKVFKPILKIWAETASTVLGKSLQMPLTPACSTQWLSACQGRGSYGVIARKHLRQGVQQGLHHCPAVPQVDQEIIWQGQERLLYICDHLHAEHLDFNACALQSMT